MVPMHSTKAVGAIHEPQGAAGILPAEESEESSTDETSAVPCWPHRSSCPRFMIPMHGNRVVGAFHDLHESRARALVENGGAPPYSTTLERWPQSRALPPGFGVRRPCGALDCPDRFMVSGFARSSRRKEALISSPSLRLPGCP